MNYAVIMGNLVRDPELKHTSSGLAVANLTIAVNRRKKDGTDKVAFIDVTMWDKRAEAFAKFHKKGDKALVQGHLDMDSWTDKATGANRTKIKLVAENWEFVKGDTKTKESSF